MDRIRAFRLGWLVGFGLLALALWIGGRTVLAALAVVLALIFPLLAFLTTFWDAFRRAYREEYERTSEEAGRRR